jgi:hypothetical protein
VNDDHKISTKNGLSSLKRKQNKNNFIEIGGERGYDTHKKMSKGENNMGKLAIH